MKVVLHLSVVVVLTLISQTGGLAYLIWVAVMRLRVWRQLWIAGPAMFLLIYGVIWLATPPLAAQAGRVPLPCFEREVPVRSVSPLYCVLNRTYVTPELRDITLDLGQAVATAHPGTVTLTTDASFPFLDGFPLLPHLSHNDGRKLDLAFYYKDETGYRRGATASPVGFWAFAEPKPGEAKPCEGVTLRPTLRWDMHWFQVFNRPLELEPTRTRTALAWLAGEGAAAGVEKVLIEPHLAERLGVTGGVIRFQGCRAARHDDHIHFQIEP